MSEHIHCPDLSVVIASHRPYFLDDLLAALAAGTLDRRLFEVIAVCDYPTSPLQTQFNDVRFIYLNKRSISAKRNRGVQAALAPIVAFIDDDCLPSKEWLSRGIAYLAAHPEAAAVEGLTTIQNADYAPPSLRDYQRLEKFGFRTNNIFYRKNAFLEAGGFDERFTVQREDIDLAFSIIEKGFIIRNSTDICVTHRVRRNEPWDLLKNCINRRFDPLLFRKHPAAYREHIGSPFPASLLMLLAFHLITLCTSAFNAPLFIATCLIDIIAITALTLRRCGKSGKMAEIITDWLSCAAAPIVLSGTLLYGSIRYRKLLLV